MMQWPEAITLSCAFLSTGGTVIAALVRNGMKSNGNGSKGVSAEVCSVRHAAIDSSLGRIEHTIENLDRKVDTLMREIGPQ